MRRSMGSSGSNPWCRPLRDYLLHSLNPSPQQVPDRKDFQWSSTCTRRRSCFQLTIVRENLHFNRCFWLAVYKPWNSYPGSAGGDPLAWNRWLNTGHLPEGSESLSQPGSQAHSALLGPRVHWALPSDRKTQKYFSLLLFQLFRTN